MPATPDNPCGHLPGPYFESDDHRFRLYQGDCLELMPKMPEASFDVIFADPPYFLSNDGITCHAGRMVSVNKGRWDKSQGPVLDHEFCMAWLAECRRLLKPTGSLWVSGTMHIIHSVGYAMQRLGMKLLNDITWVKPNPPPNLACRYFTHATETILWARKDEKARHKFNYALMKHLNGDKQMKSVWELPPPSRDEKVFGKHPTQKPVALLERIIAASTDENDLVLDPFSGSGTTGIAAARSGRAFLGVDLREEFLRLAVFRYQGVPQADSPQRILAAVRMHAGSPPALADLAESLDITPRQGRYYREAAAFLGFLDRGPDEFRLTEAGRCLCVAPQGAAEDLLAGAIRANGLVRQAERLAARASGDRAREAVAELLARSTALGPSTCLRRARTLLTWAAWARERNAAGIEIA